MNRVVLFFLIAASLFLGVGCSNSERVTSSNDSDAYFTQDTLDGMIRVQMKNASISLGTNGMQNPMNARKCRCRWITLFP